MRNMCNKHVKLEPSLSLATNSQVIRDFSIHKLAVAPRIAKMSLAAVRNGKILNTPNFVEAWNADVML